MWHFNSLIWQVDSLSTHFNSLARQVDGFISPFDSLTYLFEYSMPHFNYFSGHSISLARQVDILQRGLYK